MTLGEVINKFEEIALKQPNINEVIQHSPMYLEQKQDAKFSVFSWVVDSVSIGEEFTTFGINLFYIDRLTDDGANKLDIQSHGIQVLNNIITTFFDEVDEEKPDVTYIPFTHTYRQLCAGVYATLRFELPNDMFCPEEYDE